MHKATFIPYGRQSIDTKDVRAVCNVLQSDWLTQGPTIKEFEEKLCRYTKARYAIAVSSGTAGLHIACLAAGIKMGDQVITSPITFVASANCVLYCGAQPVFSDIQEETVNIDPLQIQKKITKKTKAIIPVHFAGYPCNLTQIHSIAKKNKLIVIEDAAHALGAEYKGSKIGACKYSDMTVFSFHPVKAITTGEGGAVTTNSKKLYEKLLALRSHGIYKDKKNTATIGGWYYEMRDLGFNYRITDLQCALGITQLKKIKTFLRRRKAIASLYNKELHQFRSLIRLPYENRSIAHHAWHLYVLRFNLENIRCLRKDIYTMLQKKNIGVQVHYIPVYTQPFYREHGYDQGKYPIAEKYYNEALSLPIYPDLRDSQVRYVIKAIKDVLQSVAR